MGETVLRRRKKAKQSHLKPFRLVFAAVGFVIVGGTV